MTVQSATAKAFEVETLDDLVEEGLNSICKNYSISEKGNTKLIQTDLQLRNSYRLIYNLALTLTLTLTLRLIY